MHVPLLHELAAMSVGRCGNGVGVCNQLGQALRKFVPGLQEHKKQNKYKNSTN